MKFIEYGSKQGRLVVYFHGALGALEEYALFDEYANKHNVNIVCFDRFSIDCHVAIETGILLGDQVKNLQLVSSAAPLESGRYLDESAPSICRQLGNTQ